MDSWTDSTGSGKNIQWDEPSSDASSSDDGPSQGVTVRTLGFGDDGGVTGDFNKHVEDPPLFTSLRAVLPVLLLSLASLALCGSLLAEVMGDAAARRRAKTQFQKVQAAANDGVRKSRPPKRGKGKRR